MGMYNLELGSCKKQGNDKAKLNASLVRRGWEGYEGSEIGHIAAQLLTFNPRSRSLSAGQMGLANKRPQHILQHPHNGCSSHAL